MPVSKKAKVRSFVWREVGLATGDGNSADFTGYRFNVSTVLLIRLEHALRLSLMVFPLRHLSLLLSYVLERSCWWALSVDERLFLSELSAYPIPRISLSPNIPYTDEGIHILFGC